MQYYVNWQLLQMFADAADTIPGVTAADAGQHRADIPRDAAAETPEKPSWEQLMADPDYNRQMQAVVRSRLREAASAEEDLQTLAPALKRLAGRYGLPTEQMDYAALTRAVTEDDAPDARNEPGLRSGGFTAHIRELERQGAALQKRYPGFDLRRELNDPVFARLTAPGSGLTVEDAYFAVHRQRLQAEAEEAASQKIADSIRAGSRRPRENGTEGQAPSVAALDYRAATPGQREALKRRIREAAARGEKVYPGR